MPKALAQQIQIVVVKFGVVMDGFVPTMTNYDEDFSAVEYGLSVAVPVLQRTLNSDHFGSNGKMQNSLVLASRKKKLIGVYW